MLTDAPDFGYASHFPALVGVLFRLFPTEHCPILELGCGHGSTHVVHLSTRGKQAAISADTDEKWMSEFAHYVRPNHRFDLVQAEVPKGSSGVNEYTKAWLDYLASLPFSEFALAFVDCWPGEARVPIIQALKGQAFAIVAHDVDADIPPGGGNYGWKRLDGLFKYERTFKRLRPWTGFWSDHFDMPELE